MKNRETRTQCVRLGICVSSALKISSKGSTRFSKHLNGKLSLA